MALTMPVNSPDDEDKVRPANRPIDFVTVLVLILVGAGLGAGAYRFLWQSSQRQEIALGQTVRETTPRLIRDAQRITIPEGSPLRDKLKIEAVSEQGIQRTLTLPAVVEADPSRLVKVLPPLAGRITQLKVQLGQRVDFGQPLVVFESSDLAAAYADYDRAKVLAALALTNRDRQRDLAKTGANAVKDMQQAETDYATAQAELRRAETRLRQIGVDAETHEVSRTVTVTAPVSGSVIDLTAAPGAFWNDANASLMTVADLSTVWVTASVPENDTSLISKHQSVQVVFSAYPGEVFEGQVLFISDVLDADTRRTKVRIALPNSNTRLKPNMFANVSFFNPLEALPTIPTTALLLQGDSDQVFVEVAPWTFERRPVEIGFQQGDRAIPRSGLKIGDRVVVKGGVLLND
jgi:membrane fusion protein, heavy metal efflux system